MKEFSFPKLQVMPDPRFAGPQHHPLHQNRYVATADAVFDETIFPGTDGEGKPNLERGSIIATMTDHMNQKEFARLFTVAPLLLDALEWIVELAEEGQRNRESDRDDGVAGARSAAEEGEQMIARAIEALRAAREEQL